MDTLNSGTQLLVNQSIASADGQFSLILQSDGNLVLYRGNFPLWASNTVGKPSKNAIMQADGNFVLYDTSAKPLFSSGTAGKPGAILKIQNDGNVVVYQGSVPLWSTQTDGTQNCLVGTTFNSKFPSVYGQHTGGGDAVFGSASATGRGVVGVSDQHTGVEGNSTGGAGVWGASQNGEGVHGQSNSPTAAAVAGYSLGQGPAGYFKGNVMVTGDVQLTGADCAEDFDVREAVGVEPGDVMTLDDEGALRRCQGAYDKRVAGIIAGAGNYKPGIVLDKQGPGEKRKPLALIGKTFCRVDASYGAVEIGDLLTTSDTPGHAMKAVDPLRAFGAVVGKALRPLKEGRGLIPVLVALQ